MVRRINGGARDIGEGARHTRQQGHDFGALPPPVTVNPFVDVEYAGLGYTGQRIGVDISGPCVAVRPLQFFRRHTQPARSVRAIRLCAYRAIEPTECRFPDHGETEVLGGAGEVLTHPAAISPIGHVMVDVGGHERM